MRLARGGWLLCLLSCGAPAPTPDEEALDRYTEAEQLFESRQYREAVPLYEFVIAKRDRLMDAYHKLARCHEALGEADKAIDVLRQALRVDRTDDAARGEIERLSRGRD